MRFLIDCTFVFSHPELNSGIQRVVRNIVGHAVKPGLTNHRIPVIFKNGVVYSVRRLSPALSERIVCRIHDDLFKIRRNMALALTSGQQKFPRISWITKLLYAIAYVVALPIFIVEFVFGRLRKVQNTMNRMRPLEMKKDDVIVLLDSSWHKSFFKEIEASKARVHSVIGVIYDVIPLTHPQYCDDALVRQYEEWFEWISGVADGYMTISKTIRDQVRELMASRLPADKYNRTWFDYFYLGSELDLARNATVRPKVRNVFASDRSVYLMVSTIEPRKNHKYLIDVFDALWQEQEETVLFFIGHQGWKSDELLARISSHPELNERFFMLNDLNDAELEFAYQHSKALLFPSFVEGFGLPLVEAMQRGLPAMASDIPVFREVGGDYCAYFSTDDQQSLKDLISTFELTGKFPSEKQLDDYKWLRWKDATDMFFNACRKNLANRRSG